MKRRLLSAFLCLCLGTVSLIANNAFEVKLSDNHPQERYQTEICNFIFTKGTTDSNNSAPINIEIENFNDNYVLIVFGTSYNEKALKAMGFKFDKHFAGEKGNIKTCSEVKFEDVDIMPQKTKDLVARELRARNEGNVQFTLPVYIAAPDGSKKDRFSKLKLLESREFMITLHVDLGPDNYKELSQCCDELVREISNQTFCTNEKHKKEQVEPYMKRINDLKAELQNNRDSLWYARNDKHKDYETLIKMLDDVKFDKVSDCGSHVKHESKSSTNSKSSSTVTVKQKDKKPHRKERSLKDLSGAMNALYLQLDNHKISKEAAVKQANKLLNGAKQSSQWGGNDPYQNTITKIYNKIIKK